MAGSKSLPLRQGKGDATLFYVCVFVNPMWVKKWGQAGFSTATERDSTSSGSKTKASNNPTISPIPDVLAQEIVEDLEAALEQFREIAAEKDQ
jgi:hypothetical protein